jgi:hypothetical protein
MSSRASAFASATFDSDDVDAMLRLSGAQPSARVTILGGARIGLLIELSRRGFAAACWFRAGATRGSTEPADIVWLPSGDDVPAALFEQLARFLRPGGVIVVGAGPTKNQTLRRRLEERGLRIVDRALGARQEILLVAPSQHRSPWRQRIAA